MHALTVSTLINSVSLVTRTSMAHCDYSINFIISMNKLVNCLQGYTPNHYEWLPLELEWRKKLFMVYTLNVFNKNNSLLCISFYKHNSLSKDSQF